MTIRKRPRPSRGRGARPAAQSGKPATRDQKARRLAANSPVLELTIERLGARGDGVAHGPVDGTDRPLFVPFTLPGERVSARPSVDRGEGVACVPMALLRTAAERVEPRCRHFMACGGCALQHARDDFYLDWKRNILRDALARAGLADVTVGATLSVGPGTRRRAALSIQRLRTAAIVGFQERESARVVDIEDCPVLHPSLLGFAMALRESMTARLASGDRADAHINRLDTGLDVHLVLPGRPDRSMLEALAALAEEQDLCRLTWRVSGEPPASAVPAAVRRPPTLRFGDVEVEPPPAAFLQASPEGEAAIIDLIRAEVGALGPLRHAVDLFSGCGTVALSLAGSARRVTAVDGDSSAIASLRAAADRAGLGGRVETAVRDLFDRPLHAGELDGADLVVFDPPRAGARAQAAELARSAVPTVVAVSCNPATFARDARSLVDGGYRLERVTPIDQFLWSPHIELVGTFRR